MKAIKIFLTVIVLMVLAIPAIAAGGKNTVSLTGDIVKEGHFVINVDWTVDTAKYPGLSREAIRKKVRDEIASDVLDKVMQATKNLNISYDKSNFTTVKENHEMLQKRPNGTKVYAIKMQIDYDAIIAPDAPPPAKPEEKKFVLQQRWNNE